MSWAGWASRLIAGGFLAGLLGLSLASGPAAFLDRGATGFVRVSAFPFALTLLDPFVWTAIVHSLIAAALIASGSQAIGVGLAVAGASWRFRGRDALWALAMVPLAAGPLLLAPALGLSLGSPRAWDWLAARSFAGRPLDDLARWGALVWSGLAWGAPIVAIATASSLRKIEPGWLEATRGTGASRGRIWREIVWPNLRLDASRASASVFTLALIEPAAPLVLGLDRTLAVQILRGAAHLDQPTRVAGLALIAIVIVGVVRTLIAWWGGPAFQSREIPIRHEAERVGFRRGMLGRLILGVWSAFAVGPLIWLGLEAFRSLQAASSPTWFGLMEVWREDPVLKGWVINSATTASGALLIDLLILASWFGLGSNPASRGFGFAARTIQAIPPLALGVGAFATPWLLDALADVMGGRWGGWIKVVTLELSPARSPGFLLILVVAAGKWPLLFRLAESARARVRPVVVEASLLMGVSDRRASDAGQSGWVGRVPGRAAILVFVLAATNLAPALLMAPFTERRTLAPAIIGSIVREGSLEPRIAGAIGLVLTLRLIGFGLAARTRVGSLGEWYRG